MNPEDGGQRRSRAGHRHRTDVSRCGRGPGTRAAIPSAVLTTGRISSWLAAFRSRAMCGRQDLRARSVSDGNKPRWRGQGHEADRASVGFRIVSAGMPYCASIAAMTASLSFAQSTAPLR